MKRWLAVGLALAMAGTARANEPVELEAGQSAPFKGALCDKECAARVVAKIDAANLARDQCVGELKLRPSAALSLLSAGVALGLGVVVGGAVVAIVKK